MIETGVHYDMYDREIFASPYEVMRRLRDEAPLYYNGEHHFYAVSRYDDVQRVLGDRDTFISGKGMTYDILKASAELGMEMPDGLFICEDPPQHTMHRALVSRLFTPRAVSALEPQIRELCTAMLDRLVGESNFDFMSEVANQIPIKVIGMLLGLPSADQAELHRLFHQNMHVDSSQPDANALAGIAACAEWFNGYLDEREAQPADDVMTRLLHMELTDDAGASRRLRRDEILTYLTLVASAGADTTAMALGWAIKALGDNPDERKALEVDRSLMPNAVEEVLRYEAVSYHAARWVASDVELHGQVVPAASTMVVLPPAANRDERRFSDPDVFRVRRQPGQHVSFGFGPHFCLGASLARLEMRVALDAFLDCFDEWTVDADHAAMVSGSNTRGWERLPIEV